MLRDLIVHMYGSSTGTLRNMIHWDIQGARKFTEKLDDQFIESLDDITSNIREMYEFGMRETSRSAITRNLRRMWLEEN